MAKNEPTEVDKLMETKRIRDEQERARIAKEQADQKKILDEVNRLAAIHDAEVARRRGG